MKSPTPLERLIAACGMHLHNQDIFAGTWKKGSKAWDGSFVLKEMREALADVQKGRVPTGAEMALDMDVDDLKDAIGKAYPSVDDGTRDMLCEKVDRLHTLAYKNLQEPPSLPPADENGKRPRLFYYEEAENAWCPAEGLEVDNIIGIDLFLRDSDTIEIQFKRQDMTDEEFEALPEG